MPNWQKNEKYLTLGKVLLFCGIVGVVVSCMVPLFSSKSEEPDITSVFMAIEKNNLPYLKKALANGLDIETRNYMEQVDEGVTRKIPGFTLLGYAVLYNRPMIAEWLIEQGADVQAFQPMGTIFSLAVAFKQEKLAISIVEHGGDFYPDKNYNPAEQAKFAGMINLMKTLEKHGVYADASKQKTENKISVSKTDYWAGGKSFAEGIAAKKADIEKRNRERAEREAEERNLVPDGKADWDFY